MKAPAFRSRSRREQAGQTAGKQANDGWRAVHHEGTSLDELRKRYEAQRAERDAAAAEQVCTQHAAVCSPPPPPPPFACAVI